MVIDTNGRFRTRREIPRMAQINAIVSDGHITLSKEGMKSIELPLKPEGESIKVQIWKAKTTGAVVSDKADDWISRAMGEPSRLVYMPDAARRRISPKYNAGKGIVGF